MVDHIIMDKCVSDIAKTIGEIPLSNVKSNTTAAFLHDNYLIWLQLQDYVAWLEQKIRRHHFKSYGCLGVQRWTLLHCI
jgi:hypothetical protein